MRVHLCVKTILKFATNHTVHIRCMSSYPAPSAQSSRITYLTDASSHQKLTIRALIPVARRSHTTLKTPAGLLYLVWRRWSGSQLSLDRVMSGPGYARPETNLVQFRSGVVVADKEC